MKPMLMILGLACFLAVSGGNGAKAQTPEERLTAAGFELPEPRRPAANYVSARRVGSLLYLAGHLECKRPLTTGKVGRDLTVEQGAKAAENVALCMLATMKDQLGALSKVKQVVTIHGMVNATEDFARHSTVMNGFSDVLVVAFGEAGKGARASVGMQSLPAGAAVEIRAVVEVE